MPWKNVKSHAQISFVTEDQIGRMADSARSQRDALLLLTLFYSGISQAELLNLRACDLLSDSTLSVQRQRKSSNRKSSGPRIIEIPPSVHQMLQSYCIEDSIEGTNRLFRVSRGYCLELLKHACRDIGLRSLHPNLLQYSRGLDLIQKTGNPEVVRNHLGALTGDMDCLLYIGDPRSADNIRNMGDLTRAAIVNRLAFWRAGGQQAIGSSSIGGREPTKTPISVLPV